MPKSYLMFVEKLFDKRQIAFWKDERRGNSKQDCSIRFFYP